MDQLGAAVSLGAELDGKPVLELEAIYREHSATVSKWVRRLWGPGGVSGSVDAEDLLQENRLYRQTAMQDGDAGLASVLDELERVLLDVAHSPEQVTPAQLEAIQKKIEARGILFKVRVVNKELQQRQEATKPAPAQNDSAKRERNKV